MITYSRARRTIPRKAVGASSAESQKSPAIVLHPAGLLPSQTFSTPCPVAPLHGELAWLSNGSNGNRYASNVSGYPFVWFARIKASNTSAGTVSCLGAIAGNGHRLQINFGAGTLYAYAVGSVNAAITATISANEWHSIVFVGRSATDRALFIDGRLAGTSTTSVTFSGAWTGITVNCGANNGYPTGVDWMSGGTSLIGALQKSIGNAEAAALSANLGSLFPALDDIVPISQAAAGVSASVAATLDALTSSSAATLLLAGSASNTLGALTSTSAATLRLAATLAGTLGSLTLASSGTLGAAVTGSLASTLGALTSTSNGAVRLSGSLAATLGALTGAAAGQLPVAGQLSQTLGALTAAGQGTLPIAGQAAQTLGALTLSATGALVAPGTGSVIATLGALTSSSAATLRLAGSATITLDALTSASTATLKIAATSASTLGALTVSAAGTAQSAITGQLGVTLGALSLSSSATVAFWSAASYQAGRVVLVPVHFGAMIAPAHDGSIIVAAGDGVAVH